MSKRSIFLGSAVTSISMEDAFWEELDRFARTRGLGWAEVVREWLVTTGPSENRSASIKETILRLLRHEVDLLQNESSTYRASWRVQLPHVREPRIAETRGARLFIGREGPAEIIVPDDEVSRRHAMLVTDGERWWVLDLKSKNGTLVRGKRIDMAKLGIGTEFVVGKSLIKLVANG